MAAPAGFGKSSLVAQWAESVERPTVWLSINPQDSIQTFFAHVLEAIRIVFPGFAAEFENEPSANALHNIKKLTSAAAEIKGGFNFVIDNGATDNAEVAGFSQELIDYLPSNVHLVIVRRITPATSLAKYASLGNLSLITSQDLKFSSREVSQIADLNGAELSSEDSKKLLEQCDGWPAAVQMVTRAIARGHQLANFEATSSSNPLSMLALETIRSLNDENKSKISRLVLLSEFELETAAIVLGEDLPEFGQEEESPDSWDKESKESGFRTLQNEVVKSRGEQLIANWLFYNGVSYKYESDYRIDTADAKHRQYKPDFYFPDIDVYLEHWAVDENGEPPSEFEGYKEGMAWKRQLHATNETTLLETTMAELWSGKAFAYLSQELTRLGITLDPNPDREVEGRRPIEAPRLVRTFRAFLTHTKSNRLTIDDLKQRLESKSAGHFYYRHKVFIELFEEIWKGWEERLQSERCIDFEDMLNSAADCIESGNWKSPYELVMVDEFQDVSQARARLIAGLLREKNKHLFAVGDDWQSINRFAGSDLSVMTEFENLFGKAVTLKLEKTFRCPQSLCDISGNFVQKNPRQLKKKVASEQKAEDQPVKIIRVDDEFKIRSAIARRIDELTALKNLSDKPLKIYVLGRYRKEREYLPTNLNPNVEVEFVTAHSSKGLEADHVIIPKMTSETLGFPSQVADDPVLQLAMPSEDSYEFAEERRLFYVALTRAKSTVTLITVAHKESSFITELVRDEGIPVQSADGKVESSAVCSRCQRGFLVQRNGPYGIFLGCSRFPRCGYTEKIRASAAVR